MIEQIKTDNNCIVKAFENNPISILHEDIHNKKVYCFKASDVGKVLGILNIRQSIQNYDEDEKVVRKVYDLRGVSQDTIFLTSQGVYRLLYNSKKEIAKKFRKWAGNILDDIIFNESAELKRQIENTQKLLEEKETQLENTQKQLEKVSLLKTKKCYNKEQGDILYAVISNAEDVNSFIKLGKAKSASNRENNYFTHNQTGEMFYVKKCYNCNLAEKVLFHILDKFRIHNNKEWFNISKDLAIYSIDIVCNFLDNFINYSEVLIDSNLLENLQNSLKTVESLSESVSESVSKYKNEEYILCKQNLNTEVPNNLNIQNEIKNIYDFDIFFKENCEIGSNFECSTYDIYGAYRLWTKILRLENKNKLTEFLNKHYKKKRKYFKDIKTSIVVYLGFRVKPFTIIQENVNNLPKYEEFILRNCEFGYNYKISVEKLMNMFNNWIKDNNYEHNLLDEKQFRAYINRHFVKTNMKLPGENGSIEGSGIWGIRLKNDEIILSKNHKSHSKIIVKVDVKTKEILEQYDSILMLRDTLKISHKTINDYIKLETIIDKKYIYRFKE